MSEDKMRINKFLVAAGVAASRRVAEELLGNAKIKIQKANGEEVPQGKIIGYQVDPEKDKVYVNGRLVQWRQQKFIYLMMNKPPGYVCTRQDIHAKKTVYELLPAKYKKAGLFTVGRLDKESEGLLLFTNDGDWANELMHPSFQKEKEYLVLITAKEELAADKFGRLTAGLTVAGKIYKMKSIQALESGVGVSSSGRWQQWYNVILTEGHKRQIRVMLEKIGGDVTKLQRIRIGKLLLGDLPLGKVKEIQKT